jgi:hypothetical protein
MRKLRARSKSAPAFTSGVADRLRSAPPGALALLGAALALGVGASCGANSASSTTGGGHAATTGTHTGGASSSSTAGGSGGGGGGTGGGVPKGCKTDADCASNPNGSVCDTTKSACVGCVTSSTCAMGQFCNTATQLCSKGCTSDADCAGAPPGDTHCSSDHLCVACLVDADCPAGKLCASSNICYPGCNAMHACPTGLSCCGATCHDLTIDLANCGACGTGCVNPPNALDVCKNGSCVLQQCKPGWANCDGAPANGCEWNVLQDGPCVCTPGATQACYQGAPGTLGIGPCKAGVQTCDPTGTKWGSCVGQVLPQPEVCGSTIDLNCDGIPGNVPDVDGDGWTACNGDCCEVAGACGADPALVNPGAFEIPGDGIDNDCDGMIDNPVTTTCSTADKFASVTGMDVIQAMDICQFTTASPPLPMKKWGVIAAEERLADGTLPMAGSTVADDLTNRQVSIKTSFGTGGVVPKHGATLGVISSGMARAAADAGWVVPIPGTGFTSSIGFMGAAPPLGTYLAAHNNNLLPGKCAGSPCPVGTGANDSVDIRLVIRVPTNAQGFSYDFRFFSAEYQSYQCTPYNDYYLAMLTSGAAGIPADHQISFDSLNNPVSVNNGFFQDCGGNGKGCGTCPFGTGALAGTGFDQVMGGATEWLTTDSPAVPGEVMTLELIVFDVTDHIYDTTVLLDNFRWQFVPVTLGTHT